MSAQEQGKLTELRSEYKDAVWARDHYAACCGWFVLPCGWSQEAYSQFESHREGIRAARLKEEIEALERCV